MKDSLQRAAWLREAKYGFFYHYLSGEPGSGATSRDSAEAWRRRTENFDVRKVARQMHELGAGYMFLTIGQNSGFYCSPNATLDRLTGRDGVGSRCATRDLFSDLADALAEYGIPLLAYTTCMAPGGDHLALEKLQSVPPWNSNKNCGNYSEICHLATDDPRLCYFLRAWSDIHREWSLRWGAKLKGWWVDGCYFVPQLYDFPDEPNGASFAAALRAGNPAALVAFNPGVLYPPIKQSDTEDYTAGEINDPWRGVHDGAEVDGIQYQVLTYAGSTWHGRPLRYGAGELAAITANIVAHGGAVTWDVPFSDEDGTMDEDIFRAFAGMKRILAEKPDRLLDVDIRLLPEGVAEFRSVSGEPFSAEWNGEVRRFEGQGPFRWKLAAPPDVSAALVIRQGDFVHTYRHVWQWEVDLSAPRELPLTASDGGAHARLELTVEDGTLAIRVDAFDSAPEQLPTLWSGSCVELFFSAGRGVPELLHLFCPPDGLVYREGKDGFVADPAIPSTVALISGGYRLDIRLPLALVPGFRPEKREVFGEIGVSCKRGKGFLRCLLFEADAPFESTAHYARFHW